jgi:predicted Fe-Mo cluster-binding NifX family protein
MDMRVICITITPDGQVGGGLGKATAVAVARVADGSLSSWEVFDVGWDVLHDAGPHGTHHGRIVRFLQEHEVTDVAAGHIGESMQNTLGKLGLRVHLDIQGDARAACLAL